VAKEAPHFPNTSYRRGASQRSAAAASAICGTCLNLAQMDDDTARTRAEFEDKLAQIRDRKRKLLAEIEVLSRAQAYSLLPSPLSAQSTYILFPHRIRAKK
jgi:hypothetical protein